MAFDLNKPADTQTIAAGPGDIRENFRALKEDRIVDAQKVAGLSPGNASGNLAVANGTLCVNLNADKLDGNDASAFATAGHSHGTATSSSNGLMSNTDKAKLDGIAAGAEVNQNAFGNVKVGTTTIQADSESDTLEIAAGTGITLTPDATNDKVTVAVTQDGHSHAAATTATAGFMAAADKSKLDGIAAGAQVNQNAFANVVAGGATIQADGVTDTLTINAGAGVTISGDATNDALTIAVTANGHTHSEATTSAGGFMSAADKSKLGGIAAGAQANQNAFSNILVGSATVSADGPTDTLELVGGTNIAITPDATNDRVTLAVTGTVPSAAACTGNAATATKLATARTIALTGGVTGSATFDGSANASIATTIAGNAPTATKLATARTINGVAFDGSANITVTAAANGGNADTVDGKHASDFAAATSGIPPGAVIYFAMSTPPTGWLKANGVAVSRTTYAALFAAIGTKFGAGDGSITFNLPELRGEFIRSYDDGRGVDSGRIFGSWQVDELKSHNHVITGADNPTGTGGYIDLGDTINTDGSSAVAVQNTGGIETRPRNIALMACIKY
jgi:microcystin-dependent protein